MGKTLKKACENKLRILGCDGKLKKLEFGEPVRTYIMFPW